MSSVLSLGAAALFACNATDTVTPTDAGPDDAALRPDAASAPDDSGGPNAVKEAGDASIDAKPTKDANGPGAAQDPCTFNRDCQIALRCECDEATGCACKPGARGTGKNGVDACDGGNQCASSVCVDGQAKGESYCSDECTGAGDCEAKLPRCVAIAGFPTSICVREPPK